MLEDLLQQIEKAFKSSSSTLRITILIFFIDAQSKPEYAIPSKTPNRQENNDGTTEGETQNRQPTDNDKSDTDSGVVEMRENDEGDDGNDGNSVQQPLIATEENEVASSNIVFVTPGNNVQYTA